MIYGITEDANRAYVKIGFTSTPNGRVSYKAVRTRLSGLQVSTWRPLIVIAVAPGSMQEEQRLHKEFRKHCVRGEWFANVGPVADWLRRWVVVPMHSGVTWDAYRRKPPSNDEVVPVRHRELVVTPSIATADAPSSPPLEQAFEWRGRVRPW